MGVFDKVQDTYYSLMDSLDAKGVPVYSIIDPIEKLGIPSLPLFLGVIIVIIAGIIFMNFGGGSTNEDLAHVTVYFNNAPLNGVEVTTKYGTEYTNENGLTTIQIKQRTQAEFYKKGCETLKQEIDFGENKVNMQCSSTTLGCNELDQKYAKALLVGEDNQQPNNCKIIAHSSTSKELPWSIIDNTLHIEPGECIDDNTTIEIICAQHELLSTPKDITKQVKELGMILLSPTTQSSVQENYDWTNWDVDNDGTKDSEDNETFGVDTTLQNYFGDYCPDCKPPVQDKTYVTYVTIKNPSGIALSGVQVKAVNALGQGVRGKNTAVTNVNGTAQLEIYKNQVYKIIATDPKEKYRDTVSQKLTQVKQQDVSITMLYGFETTIYVKNNKTQAPINNAKIFLDNNQLAITDSTGKAKIITGKGERLTGKVQHNDYIPEEQRIIGGEENEVWLDEIDESNSANVVLIASNAKGIEEPMSNVVVLLNRGGITYKECTTEADGVCAFKKTLEGTYDIEVVVPGEFETEKYDSIKIDAGINVKQKLLLTPQEVVINVLTKLEGVPKQGVEVELYETTYGGAERLKKLTSGENRRVEFNAYRGQQVFLKAWYDGEEYYGPVTTNTFTVKDGYETEIDVKKIVNNITLSVPVNTIPRGEITEATLAVDLPYFEKKGKEKFDEIIVEVWSGNPGTKTDANQTKVIIGELNKYLFLNQQVPRVIPMKSNEYYYGEQPPASKDSTSKYMKFSITDYDPTTYEIKLPLFARKLSEGNTTLYYQATWRKGRNEIKSGLQELEVITEPAEKGWHLLNDDIYAYRMFLSQFPDSKVPVTEITEKNNVYLHLDVIAGTETDTYEIDLDNLYNPKHLIPISYSGTLNDRTIQETKVYKQKFPTSISPAKDISQKAFALEAEDQLSLVIKMKALSPVEIAEVQAFNDFDNTIKFKINDAENIATPIVNVEATLELQALFGEEWMTFGVNDTLPSYSLRPPSPRNVRARIGFINNGDHDQNISLYASSNGLRELIFPKEIEVKAGETTMVEVTGVGTKPEEDKMFIELNNEDWLEVTTGAADYQLFLTGIKEDGTEFNVRDVINPQAKKIRLDVELNSFKENTVAHDAPYGTIFTEQGEYQANSYQDYNQKYYVTGDLDIQWGLITAQVVSDKYNLVKTLEVRGTKFSPESQDDRIKIDLDEEMSSFEGLVANVTNYWDETLRLSLDELESVKKSQWYNIEVYSKIFNSRGIEVEPNKRSRGTREIPARGTAKVYVKVNPPGSACNVAPNNLDVKIKTTTTQTSIGGRVEQERVYGYELNCSYENDFVTSELEDNYLSIRESKPPSSITKEDCIVTNTSVRICDADQFTKAVADAFLDLQNSDEYKFVQKYALGKTLVNAEMLDQATGYKLETIDTDSEGMLIANPRLSCGTVTVTLVRTDNNNVIGTFDETEEDWCLPDSPRFFVGILNADETFQDEGRPTLFEGLDSFKDISFFTRDLSDFLSYYSDSEWENNNEFNYVNYEDFDKDYLEDFESRTQYNWLKGKTGDLFGYYKVNEIDLGVAKKYEVQLGVVYTDIERLEQARKCFLSNMNDAWKRGNNNFLGTDNIVDLNGCTTKEELDTPSLNNITFLDEITALPITASKSGLAYVYFDSTNADECFAWDGDANIGKSLTDPTNKVTGEVNTRQLFQGKLMAPFNFDEDKVYEIVGICKNDYGYYSNRFTTHFISDKTGPEVITKPKEDTKTPTMTFEVQAIDKFNVSTCEVDYNYDSGDYSPPNAPKGECTVVSSSTKEVPRGWSTNFTCLTPKLKEDSVIYGENGYNTENRLIVKCTDTNGNVGTKEKDVYYSQTPLSMYWTCYDYVREDAFTDEFKSAYSGDTVCTTYEYEDLEDSLMVTADEYQMPNVYYTPFQEFYLPVRVASNKEIVDCNMTKGTDLAREESIGVSTKQRAIYEFNLTDLLKEGENKFHLDCSDSDGNKKGYGITVVLDTTPPEVTKCEAIGDLIMGGEFDNIDVITASDMNKWKVKQEVIPFTITTNSSDENKVLKTWVTSHYTDEMDDEIYIGSSTLEEGKEFSGETTFKERYSDATPDKEINITCYAQDIVGHENAKSTTTYNTRAYKCKDFGTTKEETVCCMQNTLNDYECIGICRDWTISSEQYCTSVHLGTGEVWRVTSPSDTKPVLWENRDDHRLYSELCDWLRDVGGVNVNWEQSFGTWSADACIIK